MKKKLYITAEAYSDMYNTKRYIGQELCNEQAANNFTANIKREIATLPDFPFKFNQSGISYRGRMIYKKSYRSYLIFYMIDEKNVVHVLRILNDLMDWETCLRKVSLYHYIKKNN